MSKSQQLRRSQYITTFGPGAILEGPDGPRVILSLENSSLFDQRKLTDFEITDQDLSQALLDGARIVSIPSNAELGVSDLIAIYKTKAFPAWALCVRHGILYRKLNFQNNWACPACGPLPGKNEAWAKVRREAIRFVRACPNGHLDDVDWVRIVDHNKDNCDPTYLRWTGGGGSLRNINIECPDCKGNINLGLAYGREWSCSGRFPEQSSARPGSCNQPSKIIQRGAANLHISELQTALTIPPRSTNLHRIFETLAVRVALRTAQPKTKQELLNILQVNINDGLIRPSVYTAVNNYDEQDILDTVNDTIAGVVPRNAQELRIREFNALRRAATDGAPPQPSSRAGRLDHQFEVVQSHVKVVTTQKGYRLRITPVNRLRVVMVQTGYRRMIQTKDFSLAPLTSYPLVPCRYDDGQLDWYPGVELFGEGIFIDLAPGNQSNAPVNHFSLSGSAANTWFDAWIDPERYDPRFVPEIRDQFHPVFIWWHTLAHRLINALSVDSGYSSAAVRERIYIDVDENTGDASGGILLYTVQPGGDGTLGGLIALVPQFQRVLDSAFRNIDACSNDPLCSEETFAPEKYNGAACYACSLISETSCEYRNMRLDRNLLLNNLP